MSEVLRPIDSEQRTLDELNKLVAKANKTSEQEINSGFLKELADQYSNICLNIDSESPEVAELKEIFERIFDRLKFPNA